MAETPRLSTRLVLEEATRVPDGGGGFTLGWAPLGTLWGEIAPVGAREREIADRITSAVTHRIAVRLAQDPSARPQPDQRLRAGGRVFAIRGVGEADRHRAYLTVWAEEGPFS